MKLLRKSGKSLAMFMVIFFTNFTFGCSAPTIKADTLKEEDKSPTAKKIKIALLLDTSNSMDGLIDQAKSQLWTIVNELSTAKCDNEQKPEIQIALYQYGNNALPASEGYIQMVTPLTNDLDKISEDLFKLKTNGGDEFCGEVIKRALDQLDWSSETHNLQLIFIAGNEPFNQGRVDYRKSCAEARSKNIIVNTIFCGNMDEGIRTNWKDGADLTGGNYMSIEQNRKTVYIETPYDDKITELNKKLNDTYVEYGIIGREKKATQAIQDRNAESYSKANSVERAVSKSSHVYKNSTWDLVDASQEKGMDITKIKSEELPENMKNMTDNQKIQYIKDKEAERNKIRDEITQTNKQREAYLAEQRKETTDDKMLDKAMINSIKKQAKEKNFTF